MTVSNANADAVARRAPRLAMLKERGKKAAQTITAIADIGPMHDAAYNNQVNSILGSAFEEILSSVVTAGAYFCSDDRWESVEFKWGFIDEIKKLRPAWCFEILNWEELLDEGIEAGVKIWIESRADVAMLHKIAGTGPAPAHPDEKIIKFPS
jgi:hypothetical protein